MSDLLSRPGLSGDLMLLVAAALLYVVARSAADALDRGRETTAGRLAVAQAMPVAAVAWTAALYGHADFALGATLGSALAGLTLVAGVTLLGHPVGPLPASSRAWPLLLPIALVLLLIGFASRIGLDDAAMLLTLGVLAHGIWRTARTHREEDDRLHDGDGVDRPEGAAASGDDVVPVAPYARPALPDAANWRVVQLVITLVLAGVAGWLAVRAGVGLTNGRRGISAGVVGVTVVSTMLALPGVGAATFLSRTGRGAIAIGASAGGAILNLTVVLPVAVLVWRFRSLAVPTSATTQPTTLPSTFDVTNAFPFGVGFWRIETVLLVALALTLIPLRYGAWRPGKAEGALLVIGYAFYMLLVTAAGMHWH